MLWFLLACNDFQVIDETQYVEPQFDIFEVQAPPPGVDIVAVLDGSGSMEDNWDEVYAAFPGLMNGIASLNSPWRFTAISADPLRVAPQTWIDQSTPNLEWNSIGQMQRVQNLSGVNESGLDASLAFALNYPAEFVEQNDLYWIFVSDEEDFSSVTPDIWKDLFNHFKVTPNTRVYSGAIVEVGTGCGDTLGTRYVETADVTVDLCSIDYTPLLAPLQARITPVLDTFPLEAIPEVSSLDVYINGIETSDWTYNAELNDVYISAPIPMNSTVIITYYLDTP